MLITHFDGDITYSPQYAKTHIFLQIILILSIYLLVK